MTLFRQIEEEQIIDFQGTRLRFRFRPGIGDTLLILFHGAMQRNKRRFPQYQGFMPLPCPQISLADPGMDMHANLATSWYLGDVSQNLTRILPAFFSAAAVELGTTRRIFVGGSSGGFAALLYAYLCGADSLSIASCPQVDLSRYWVRRAVDQLRSLCFPDSPTLEDLAGRVPLDLSKLYGPGFDNHAIVLISGGDRHHLSNQLTALLGAIPEDELGRVLLHVSYWGIPGHSGSVPALAWSPWVELALRARDWSADALMQNRWEVEGGWDGPAPQPEGGFSESDMEKAEVLRRLALSRADSVLPHVATTSR